MRIKRYLKLFLYFYRYSFLRELEFRFNLFLWIINSLIWLFMGYVSINLLFGQVNTIAGWTKDQVMLLLFIVTALRDIFWMFIASNLQFFMQSIRKGEFDFFMLKPINLRFLVSVQRFRFKHWVRFFIALFFSYQLIIKLGYFNYLNIVLAIFVWFWALIIVYALFFLMATSNFWFINLFNLVDLFSQVILMGRMPVSIFSGFLKTVFIYIIPMAFIAFFPVQILKNGPDYKILVLAPILAILMIFASQKFFNFALKHYSSASS